MFKLDRQVSFLAALALIISATADFAIAHGPAPAIAEVEELTLNTPCNDQWCGGTIVVAGEKLIIPRNLLIDLPANRLTLRQLFDQAPAACKTLGQSGLARADTCLNGAKGAQATINANRSNCGGVIIGDLFIQKGPEAITGSVTFINYAEGYLRINGTPGQNTKGTLVRVNDPTSKHTIQRGLGCAGTTNNCSPDPRFTNDPDNYTVSFNTGYPLCIPSTVVSATHPTPSNAVGVGDPACPDTNRTVAPVPDSTRFAPIKLGDVVTAEGGIEVVNDVRFLSAHTLTINTGLTTRALPTQPDYVLVGEAEFDTANFPRRRARARFLGNTTLPDSQLDIFTLRVDPRDNESHEDILSSTVGNPRTFNRAIAGPGGIWRIFLDVDFLQGIPVRPEGSPCTHLANAGLAICSDTPTLAEEFSRLSPVPREIIVRSRHKERLNTGVVTRDINNQTSQNGEYLMPLGVGLGGFELPVPDEFDLGFGVVPFVFEGFPWMLDRRLSPGGCVGNCENTPQPLEPFPVSGIDPRGLENDVPASAADRTITYFLGADLQPRLIASFPPVDRCPGPALSNTLIQHRQSRYLSERWVPKVKR